jgi:hypothetical protein
MSYALPPRTTDQTAWLLASLFVLVAIGGNCRGALAQQRTLETLGPTGVEVTHEPLRVTVRKGPMTAVEWAAAWDACTKTLGTPFVAAGRNPAVSAGIGCLPIEVMEP